MKTTNLPTSKAINKHVQIESEKWWVKEKHND